VDYDAISMEEFAEIEDSIHAQIDVLLNTLENSGKNIIIVANELGLGLVPAYRMGRFFRDIAGRVNQRVAARANHVYFTVSGIPMKIK
jgi:adenosylcobinamide kinase/adenosylcobinamide-phosphate guanylyltransferase